jgi:hypothetical protein
MAYVWLIFHFKISSKGAKARIDFIKQDDARS